MPIKPTTEQVATTIFVHSRSTENQAKTMDRIKSATGLPALWINRIIKKGWGWQTDSVLGKEYTKCMQTLYDLEATGSLPSSGLLLPSELSTTSSKDLF